MSDKEPSLPKPPKTPFGRRRDEDQSGQTPLMADRIAAAMAEGRIEEFLRNEVPDNDQARALVSMMMGLTGMSGMMPMPGAMSSRAEVSSAGDQAGPKTETEGASTEVPEDVVQAIQSADVAGLTGLLQREFQKRAQVTVPASAAETPTAPDALPDKGPAGEADKEKEILDSLIKIAADNNVSVDWVISRALKLYAEEYQKTGRL